jgi:hypothetical protein
MVGVVVYHRDSPHLSQSLEPATQSAIPSQRLQRRFQLSTECRDHTDCRGSVAQVVDSGNLQPQGDRLSVRKAQRSAAPRRTLFDR